MMTLSSPTQHICIPEVRSLECHECFLKWVHATVWDSSTEFSPPLQYQGEPFKTTSAFHKLAAAGRADTMKLEVLQYGQNPNEVDAEGKTPLMHAVWMNRQAAIELLLLPEAGLGQVTILRCSVCARLHSSHASKSEWSLVFDFL